jgi:hypothetical protein
MARPGHRPSDSRKAYIGCFFFDLVVLVVVVELSVGVCVVVAESVVDGDGLIVGSGAVVAGLDVVGLGGVVLGAVVVGDPGAGVVCASAAVERVSVAIAVRVVIRIGSSPFRS